MQQDPRPNSAFNIRAIKPSPKQFLDKSRPITATNYQPRPLSPSGEFNISDKMMSNWKSVRAAKDKEGLFEEQVHLNNEVSRLKYEYEELQMRQKLIEEEAKKVGDYILKIEAFVVDKKGPKINEQQSWLVINLKKKLIELKEAIDAKQKEVECNKKDAKYLKRTEYNIQVEEYKKCILKIKEGQNQLKQLTQSTKDANTNNNRNHLIPFQQIHNTKSNFMKKIFSIFREEEEEMPLEEFERLSPRSMRRNVMQLRTNLMLLKEENDKLSVQRDFLATEGENKYKKLIQLEEQEELDIKELEKLNHQMEEYKQFQEEEDNIQVEQQQQQEDAHKAKKQQLQQQNNKTYQDQIKEYQNNEKNQIFLAHQKESIDRQAQSINKLSKILEDLKKKDKEEQERISAEKIRMEKELIILKQKNQKRAKEETALAQQLEQLYGISTFPEGMKQTFSISKNILQKHEPAKVMKVPKIESYEVQRIGKEINFRLRLKRVPMEYAISKLISPQVKKIGFVSLEYLIKKLRVDPFNMADKNEAMALGRFIVEDNSENMVEVNLAKKCHYKVARSVFKSLVGRIKIYSNDAEEMRIWEKCGEEIEKNIGALKQYGEICFLKKNPEISYVVNWEQVKETFQYVSNEFDSEKIDYILMRLFEETNDVNKLHFLKIFDIFNKNNWRSIDQRTHNSRIFKPGQISYVLDHHLIENSESEDDVLSVASNQQISLQQQQSQAQYQQQQSYHNHIPHSTSQNKTQLGFHNQSPTTRNDFGHVQQSQIEFAPHSQSHPIKNSIKFNLSPTFHK